VKDDGGGKGVFNNHSAPQICGKNAPMGPKGTTKPIKKLGQKNNKVQESETKDPSDQGV